MATRTRCLETLSGWFKRIWMAKGRRLCLSNSRAHLPMLWAPLYLCCSEVTISNQASTTLAHAIQQCLFGSCTNLWVPWKFSDTLCMAFSGPCKAFRSAGQLLSKELTLSKWGWELIEKCFCLSSPRQAALTHLTRLLRTCQELQCPPPDWWPTW